MLPRYARGSSLTGPPFGCWPTLRQRVWAVRNLLPLPRELQFLPPYSPDLSPIEEAFSMVNALLKGAKARPREALVEAMGPVLGAVRVRDARGWFARCGYAVGDRRS